MKIEDVVVNLETDTQKDGWSIAAGNYSCRFAPATVSATHLAAVRLREKLARIAAPSLNVPPDKIDFAEGKVFARDNPDNALSLHRVAGQAHWSPASLPDGMAPALRESVTWSAPELTPTTARRRDQHVASLWVRIRFLRRRDRPRYRRNPHRQIRDQPRLRNDPQSGPGGRADPRLVRGGDRRLAVRGIRLWRGRQFPVRHVCRLSHPHGGGNAEARYPAPGAIAVAIHPAGRQRHCRRQSVQHAGLSRQCGCRRAWPRATSRCRSSLQRSSNGLPAEEPPSRARRPYGCAHESAGHHRAGISDGAWNASRRSGRRCWTRAKLRQAIPGCERLERVGTNAFKAGVMLGVGPVRGQFEAEVGSVRSRGAALGGAAGQRCRVRSEPASGAGRLTLAPTAGGCQIDYRYEIHLIRSSCDGRRPDARAVPRAI